MSSGRLVCPKCKHTSGDDWYQCGSSCPMPMSPCFNPKELDFLEAMWWIGFTGLWRLVGLWMEHPDSVRKLFMRARLVVDDEIPY